MKKSILVLIFLSLEAFGQSLECQILREEILAEARNPNRQEQNAYNQAYRASGGSSNPFSGLAALQSQFGTAAGNQFSGAIGGGSLENKLAIYKQVCEK